MTQPTLIGGEFNLKTPAGLLTPAAFVRQVLDGDDAIRRRFGIDNWASEYAEPGYSDPASGILFGDWNDREGCTDRKRFVEIAEHAGFELEWSDEWSACSDCGKAVRTSPDSYGWTASFSIVEDCEIVCVECLTDDPASHLARLEDNPQTANTISRINPASHGYVRYNGDFENGFHPGQTDNPTEITKTMQDLGFSRILFNLESVGQFDVRFSAWHVPKTWEVLAGNVGSVYHGTDEDEARRKYAEYVERSTAGVGRVAHEAITLFCNDEIVLEHEGSQPADDDDAEDL